VAAPAFWIRKPDGKLSGVCRWRNVDCVWVSDDAPNDVTVQFVNGTKNVFHFDKDQSLGIVALFNDYLKTVD